MADRHQARRKPPFRAGDDRRRRSPAPQPAGAGLAESERLQKVLAHAGVGSRRNCEELILQGRVTVDGKVVRELGTRVDPRQARIALDGQPIYLERPVYFAVHKPRGFVSTNRDPAGRPLVVDLLPEIPQRVYTVGRLDEASVGLMILTNDGELANKLAHPRFGVEKVYRALVAGTPTREVLDQIMEGVWLAEGKVRARRVRVVGHKGEATVLEMVLAEGKNREVRRMLAKFGHKVMSLVRVAIGPVRLRGLKPGQFRPLTGEEIELLRRVASGEVISEPEPAERKRDRSAARGGRGGGRRPGPHKARGHAAKPGGQPRIPEPGARPAPPRAASAAAPPPAPESRRPRRVIGLNVPPERPPGPAGKRPASVPKKRGPAAGRRPSLPPRLRKGRTRGGEGPGPHEDEV